MSTMLFRRPHIFRSALRSLRAHNHTAVASTSEQRPVLTLKDHTYTIRATAEGNGRMGHVFTGGDSPLQLDMGVPRTNGGKGNGPNPEQLFAMGYASCFLGAIRLAASRAGKKELGDAAQVHASVRLGHPTDREGLGLSVNIDVEGIDDDAIIASAHERYTIDTRLFRPQKPMQNRQQFFPSFLRIKNLPMIQLRKEQNLHPILLPPQRRLQLSREIPPHGMGVDDLVLSRQHHRDAPVLQILLEQYILVPEEMARQRARDIRVPAPEVPQPPVVRVTRRAVDEVVRDVRVMQEKRDRVDQEHGSDARRERGRLQEVSRDDGAPVKLHVSLAPAGAPGGMGEEKPVKAKAAVFGIDEEEEDAVRKRKAPLVKLDFSATNNEEKAKERLERIKASVPTDKETLFKSKVRWDGVTDAMIDRKFEPLVKRLMVKYLGELEDDDLVMFVLEHVKDHKSPQKLIEGLEPVLEEEASELAISVWRQVIFESMAYGEGLHTDRMLIA
ncbi:hypothetical protein EWM64_g5529 [Hericium alpestre]|uniref:PWI domain-containing protein n=1 Tax=Hericium alpestre TaxID=135208 RepID=A0A4Y9ZWP6_9AGAM|nr:hypothetical protein EWM64_g5529 [Hericium alpestre]